jgi:hypothetical protein
MRFNNANANGTIAPITEGPFKQSSFLRLGDKKVANCQGTRVYLWLDVFIPEPPTSVRPYLDREKLEFF